MAKLGFLLKSGPFASPRGEDLYHMAVAALNKGHEVYAFFDLDGVYQALDTQKSTEVLELPKDRFAELIAFGATIYLCTSCLTLRGINDPEILIDGVKVGSMEDFATVLGEVDKMIAL